MSLRAFELEWQGGAPERLFRRRRDALDLPWEALDPRDFPPALVARARGAWTEGAWSEYCSAAAFADVQKALLQAGAPVDLVGAAGEFVADEMLHVELNARVVMALGGAPPVRVDLEAMTPTCSARDPLLRAAEVVVRTCCVGEALSVPLLGGTRLAAARHPLVGAVLERIVHDEGPHAALGWWFLEWADARLDDAARARLGAVAADALRDVAGRWCDAAAPGDLDTEGWLMADVNALGWMDPREYREVARRAVRERVVAPLARFGVAVPGDAVERALA